MDSEAKHVGCVFLEIDVLGINSSKHHVSSQVKLQILRCQQVPTSTARDRSNSGLDANYTISAARENNGSVCPRIRRTCGEVDDHSTGGRARGVSVRRGSALRLEPLNRIFIRWGKRDRGVLSAER